MKEKGKDSHENNKKHGRGVFTSRRKMALEPTMASKHLPRRTKTEGGLEKRLANSGSRQKITKTTHAGRGH
jgi:hypothetical protein